MFVLILCIFGRASLNPCLSIISSCTIATVCLLAVRLTVHNTAKAAFCLSIEIFFFIVFVCVFVVMCVPELSFAGAGRPCLAVLLFLLSIPKHPFGQEEVGSCDVVVLV